MDTQTVLLFLAPVLPFIVSARDQWHKWHKEGKVKQAHLTVGMLLTSLLVAWALVYVAGEQRQAQLAQVRRDTEAQRQQLSEQFRVQKQDLETHLAFQKQDLEARLAAQEDRSRLIAEGCISDPKLRQRADAIHPKLQRGVGEELHISDRGIGVVKRASEKAHEPRRTPP